ncbi:S41 family peptidase, partial [Cyclobacteriaceae bacterium]|nr:S41 family peptidase [Cyclobacteriaceae bacterium]
VDTDYERVSTSPLNELNIERVYILVSNRSASASELLIAGLLPYMEVRIIGDQTVGKNEGSRTLYDSPQSDFTEKDRNLNSNHTYAIQPIISKLANSLDFSDYSTGFLPDIEAKETDYLEFMRPLGADDELLLSIAIDEITGRNGLGRISPFTPLPVIDEPHKNPFIYEMYLNGISN